MAKIEINGMPFEPVPGINYKYDYVKIAKTHASMTDPMQKMSLYRELTINDLWFFTYFVRKVSIANHPHWVDMCRTVEEMPLKHAMYLWFREGGKSTIITENYSVQRKLRAKALDNFDERICILSYTRDLAQAFLGSIKYMLEDSDFLKAHFPDVLWMNPKKDAPNWGLGPGLVLKRDVMCKEACFEAWGLTDGQPTGRHFTGRVYDDIVTHELSQSPNMMQKVKDSFDMSENLGASDPADQEREWDIVIGTYYHHDDPLVYIAQKTDRTGEPLYTKSIVPATVDGSVWGESRYHSEEKLDKLRSNVRLFYTQQLLDPTPKGTEVLNPDFLQEVEPDEIPKGLYRFMCVDPAGTSKRKDREDSWGMVVVGVVPERDNIGLSDVYILDLMIKPMSLVEAQDEIVRMVLRSRRRIRKLGVEKVGASTYEVHVQKALKARQILYTQENGRLIPLMTRGRPKDFRIETALSVPLSRGKLKISKRIPKEYRDRLREEMRRFPMWHDDGLDALSYAYDILKDYNFSQSEPDFEDDEEIDVWDEVEEEEDYSWMVQ